MPPRRKTKNESTVPAKRGRPKAKDDEDDEAEFLLKLELTELVQG